MKIVHDFMGNNRVIMDISTSNKSHLKWRDAVMKMSFQPMSNDFRNSLIGYIAQTNRPEMVHS